MKFVELNTFKKDNQVDFVDWNKPAIKAGGLWYKLKNVNVGGTNYPYVCVPDVIRQPKQYTKRVIEFPKETTNKINKINENKADLKQVSYLIESNEYFVTGIGKEAIRAYKNDNDEEQYFRYSTKEGKSILNYLYNKIGQSVLA